MAREIVALIPYVVAGLLALALLLFLVALHQLHRSRRGAYWRIRRESGQRGGRLLLLSVGLFALSVSIAFFSGFAALALGRVDWLFPPATEIVAVPDELTPTPSAEAPDPTATETPLPRPTVTPLPTETPPPTPTATPTATLIPTNTVIPSNTPEPTPTYETALALAEPPGARSPRPDATVRIVAADVNVSSNDTPLEPRTSFEAGIDRIYFFIGYRNMDDGVAWSRVLLREGAPLQGSAILWSLGEEGTSYFYFGAEDGYPPGNYSVQIWIADQVVSEFPFTITPP